MRVLYVEDDDGLAKAVERMLEQAGHNCDRARSGGGAVRLGQTNDYDLILLDVMLPDFDGYEVLRKLRDAGIRTPHLIQSGLVERDKAMAGKGFGVEDYLIKPFNREELIRRVEEVGARARASARTRDHGPEAENSTRSTGTVAQIVHEGNQSGINCTIVSVSSGGAVIDLGDQADESLETFVLVVPGDKGYRCETCWQHGSKIGVKFA